MWGKFEKNKYKLREQYSNPNRRCGLPDNVIEEHCLKMAENKEGIPMGKLKCDIMDYIFENAQIDVNPDEFFADNINHGGIVQKIIFMDSREGEAEQRRRRPDEVNKLIDGYAFRPYMDFGHLAPDWNFLIKNGIPGILKRLAEHKAKNSDKAEFYEYSERAYAGIKKLMVRLAEEAEQIGTEKMKFVAENLRWLTANPPKTLAQAMQLTILIYSIQTNIDGAIIRSLGSLDRMYVPFYRRDIESGEFSEEQLRELTADFMNKLFAMRVNANVPFYLCGTDDEDNEVTNEYTYILLEEYRKLNVDDPKMHIMCTEKLPEKIINIVMEMIREGKNSFVFINTRVASKALENIGIEPEDAKRVILYGCYEPAAEGTEVCCSCAEKFNLPKILEITLNNGVELMTGEKMGLCQKDEYDTFEEFYEAYKNQIKYCAEAGMEVLSTYEKNYYKMLPFPIYSATLEECVKKGVDVYRGGAKYNNTSIVACGIATMADSLIAIKKLIFDEKSVTFAELKDILKNNWSGYENLRKKCLDKYPKFGNGIKEVDFFAADMCDFLAGVINGKPNGRGGVFRLGAFTIDWRFDLGLFTGATPDGRLAKKTISKNFSPAEGQDKIGVTGMINSVTSINAENIPDGSVLDVVLHRTAVTGSDGIIAMKGLLKAFLNCGGFAIQFNVFDPEELKKAQREPEKYKNLQVRLCGWNVYFVDLSKQEQDEFIVQAIAAE